MQTLSYDLHIHSCLSPCGDDDMTPGNIVGMAIIKQLDVIALTDHNSCKNCPAFVSLANEYGLTVICGMELTTAEEVHVLCLFPSLEKAMTFDSYIEGRILPIPNNPSLWGKQQIMDNNDNEISTFPTLLISATSVTFHEVYPLVTSYGGIMIPAHIDKPDYSLISNLGFVPSGSLFHCAEVHNLENLHTLKQQNPYLNSCQIICNSDAHYLEHIHEPSHTLYANEKTPVSVLESLQRLT